MGTYFEDRLDRVQGEQHMLVIQSQLGPEDWPSNHSIVYGDTWIEALTQCCDAQFGTNFECVVCGKYYHHHTGKAYSWETLNAPPNELEHWISYWTGWGQDEIEITIVS